jgi:hypothetical protein
MLNSHVRAMEDIELCRTEAMGGHVYQCTECKALLYSYHSCKNRHCPKCQNRDATAWIEAQHKLLLPVPYYMVTYTLPEEMRHIARSHQKHVYSALFRASAAALKKLALDHRYLGARIGMVGVLQTWTRDMMFHPHIHYIVPGGGLSTDRTCWIPTRHKSFLVPVTALGRIFKAKFRDEMEKTRLFDEIPSSAWKKDWVVHCEHVASGREALTYLAPYVYRIAISNNRILKCEDDHVTFRFRENDTGKWRSKKVHVHEFIRRFLQHVLPRSFIKVRYYGFMAHKNRHLIETIRGFFGNGRSRFAADPDENGKNSDNQKSPSSTSLLCPHCGNPLHLIRKLPGMKRGPPHRTTIENPSPAQHGKYSKRDTIANACSAA